MKIRTRIPAKVVAKPPQQPIQTTLQRHSISNSLPKKSEIKTQPKISNDQHYINKKNDYFFDHIISKLPIQSQYELTTNSYVQNKVSSHKNSCGCPVCRKPTQISLKIRPKLLKHHNLSLTANKTIIFPSSTINKKIAAKNSNSSTTQSASSNPQLIAQKTPPTIQRGLFSRIKKGFKKVGRGFKRTASRTWRGFKRTASRTWRGIKKVGNSAWKALKKAGKFVWNGLKWIGKQLWSKLTGIFYRVIRWITKLPTRIGRLLLHIWRGVKSLKPWSVKWWQSLGNISSWGGLLSWLGTSLVYLLEIAGIGEIYETIIDFVKFNTRPLTSSEIAKARIVFGNSINYQLVRVDKRALITDDKRPYVSFHTINAWGPLDDHTLIHELTHVWQYEKMGAIYMPKALHDQKFGAGYDYGGISKLAERKDKGEGFNSFNLEQQGEILGDYYYYKEAGSKGKEDLKKLDSKRYKDCYKDFKDNNPTWTHSKIESEVEAAMQREARSINLSIYEYFVKQVR